MRFRRKFVFFTWYAYFLWSFFWFSKNDKSANINSFVTRPSDSRCGPSYSFSMAEKKTRKWTEYKDKKHQTHRLKINLICHRFRWIINGNCFLKTNLHDDFFTFFIFHRRIFIIGTNFFHLMKIWKRKNSHWNRRFSRDTDVFVIGQSLRIFSKSHVRWRPSVISLSKVFFFTVDFLQRKFFVLLWCISGRFPAPF